jgi:hypothetical protein
MKVFHIKAYSGGRRPSRQLLQQGKDKKETEVALKHKTQ